MRNAISDAEFHVRAVWKEVSANSFGPIRIGGVAGSFGEWEEAQGFTIHRLGLIFELERAVELVTTSFTPHSKIRTARRETAAVILDLLERELATLKAGMIEAKAK